MRTPALDILLAFKALSLASGLNENDRRVAGTLLEHFNRKTGQCDPSLGRIANLLGVSTRTVIRSIHRLEKFGLFHKSRHGGHSYRNSYEPIWARFTEIEATWDARFRNKKDASEAAGLSPAPCQSSHVGDDGSVTQTCPTNQLNLTCSNGNPRKHGGEDLSTRTAMRSGDAARAAAERRWYEDLHNRFAPTPVTYGEIIGAIDPTMREAATDAEVHRHGDGLAHIVTQLGVWSGRRAAEKAKPARHRPRDPDNEARP